MRVLGNRAQDPNYPAQMRAAAEERLQKAEAEAEKTRNQIEAIRGSSEPAR